MKPLFLSILLLPILALAQSTKKGLGCNPGITINPSYSKAKAVQEVMDKYTVKDLPGISIAIYSETEGWWAGASGYSKTEDKTPMNICHLQYTQSVSKPYMAVAILKLHEQGKIELDVPFTKYLPQTYSHNGLHTLIYMAVIVSLEHAMLNAHHNNNLAPLITLGVWAAAFVWFIVWIG